jgi:hypothetical protein
VHHGDCNERGASQRRGQEHRRSGAVDLEGLGGVPCAGSAKSRALKRKDEKFEELNAAEQKRSTSTSGKTQKFDVEWRKEKSAACDPIRLRLGMIDLLKPPLK